MDAVKVLEQTMEESFDQDEIIIWPPPEGDTRITVDHARYADSQKIKFICSVPLRLGGEPVAVLVCERNHEAFLEDEQRLLTLYTEMAVRRLSELKRTDRWFGARMALAAREQLAKAVGVEHTWAKVVAVLVAAGLAVLFFGKMNYRVEAPFILRTDDVAIISAPFEGYIAEVPAQIGDPVKPDDLLLKLDTRDLLLQEAAASADIDRFAREADKARAANSLAEMRIAQAQAEQAQVRLELIRYRLSQSALKAPFAGVVVEGDLRKRIGAPLKQGDMLFKVARLDRMYVECNVSENDIHELRSDATGEIAFASQPKLTFPMKVQRIEPAAEVKDKGNVFIVRCHFEGSLENWWRPGMSGVAKLNVGKRTFFWIISHRTVDFLRMYFWW
jgi:RND family efflux transporter MFP subunit